MISDRISNHIPPQMKFLNSNALLQFCLKLEHCKLQKTACHLMKCDVNDVKLLTTVYNRRCKFLMLSN